MQRNAGFFGSFFEDLVADLQQDTDTIAGFAFGILTGTVFQVLHNLQSIVDRFVGFAALDIHHRADAAGFHYFGLCEDRKTGQGI